MSKTMTQAVVWQNRNQMHKYKPALDDADADFGLRGGACFEFDATFDAFFPFDCAGFFASAPPPLPLPDGVDSAEIDDEDVTAAKAEVAEDGV